MEHGKYGSVKGYRGANGFFRIKEYSYRMYDPNAVKIYTDGSAKPNPGKGGIGMVIEFPEDTDKENYEKVEGYKHTTNNRMELLGCIRALEWLQGKRFTRAIIITDSDYVYSNYKNVSHWKKNGWVNKSGRPYENEDLWDIFLKIQQKVHINNEIVWEKGKTRDILCRVDKLAKEGSAHPTMTDFGFKPGKFTSNRTDSKKAATLFEAQGQELYIRVYMKKVYGKKDKETYKITFNIYNKETKTYGSKYFAYINNKCAILKRNNCYMVTFNNDKDFPLILEALHVDYLK